MNEWLEWDGGSPLTGFPKGSKWVTITAHIKEVGSGEIRPSREMAILKPGEKYPDPYIWRDGNFACDCNRGLFYSKAGGEEEKDADCGEELFKVNLENPATGEIYYREFV